MLIAKQITPVVIAITSDGIYVFVSAKPYIKEFPSVRKVGKYLLHFGSKLIRYDTSTTPPVPKSTPVFDLATTENNTISATTITLNRHQHDAEKMRFCATELSQKYAL